MRNFLAFSAVVAVLVGLVVLGAQFLKLPPVVTYVAIGVGALVVAVRGVVDVLQHVRGSNAPTSDPEADARVIARREVRRRRKQLLYRFATVVAALKAAQAPPRFRYRERGGAPWWLVVGPAGHGKSELLRAAPDVQELAPPLEPDEPRFFLAAGAVFLELPEVSPPTAGPALAALFAALRRLRPGHPLAGVLVVHRADALIEPASVDLRSIRRQIDHAAFALGVQVPVLLVVSQLDRLAGLAELLDGLHPVRAPLGVNLPLREGKGSVHAAAITGLGAPDSVLEWMRQRCHALVARAEPGAPAQTRLYGLWQQFSRISGAAATAAGQLAQDPLPGGDALRMRGIYFTSAHPDAFAPDDRWAAALAQRVGGSLVADLVPAPALQPAFVADLFTGELTRAGLHATRLRRHLRRRFAASALLALSFAAAAAFTVHGSTRAARLNENLLQTTLDSARAVVDIRTDQLAPIDELDRLRRAVATWRAPNAPDDAGWGLFRGDELGAQVTDAYRRAVCHAVLRPLAARTHKSLRQFATRNVGAGQPGRDAAREAFDHLRAYLLLSAPGAPGEPSPWGETQSRWLQDHVVAVWNRADNEGEDPRRAEVLADHVALLGAPDPDADPRNPCARTGHARAVERDLELVVEVREILNRNPADRDQIARMVEQIDRRSDLAGVHVRGLITAQFLHSEYVVPASFTRAGWSAFQDALEVELDSGGDQPWVLGHEEVTESREARCTNLRKLYTDLYRATWERFVDSLTLTSPQSLDDAAAIFKELSEETPLATVFKAIAEHTQNLPPIPCSNEKSLGMVTRALAKLSSRPVGVRPSSDAGLVAAAFVKLIAFSAPPAGKGGVAELDNYHKRLEEVRTAIDKARENHAERPALAAAVADAIADVKSAVQRGPFGAWKERLQALLSPPLRAVEFLLDDGKLRELHDQWCARVYTPLQRSVVGRYPFVADARVDARAADLTALFHPQTGEIAKFRGEHLATYFEVRGDTLAARDGGNAVRHPITGPTLDFFDAAHKLGLLLHGSAAGPGDAGGALGLDLGLLLRCEATVQKVVLAVDGATLEYDCSIDQTKQIHWPGKDNHGARLVAHGGDARTDTIPMLGEFGLLRLLEQASPKRRPNQSTFDVVFALPRREYGKLRATIHPRELRGGNLFFGFGGDRFLAPLRAHGFTHPPQALVANFTHTCPPP